MIRRTPWRETKPGSHRCRYGAFELRAERYAIPSMRGPQWCASAWQIGDDEAPVEVAWRWAKNTAKSAALAIAKRLERKRV